MTSRVFKTKAMQLIEQRLDKPLEEWIAGRYDSGATQAEIATELGITSATVSRWMYHLGIEAQYRRRAA